MKSLIYATAVLLGLAQTADAGCFLFWCTHAHHHHRVHHAHTRTIVKHVTVIDHVRPSTSTQTQTSPIYPPEK